MVSRGGVSRVVVWDWGGGYLVGKSLGWMGDMCGWYCIYRWWKHEHEHEPKEATGISSRSSSQQHLARLDQNQQTVEIP